MIDRKRNRRRGTASSNLHPHASSPLRWHQALPWLRRGDRVLRQVQDALRGYQAALPGLLEGGAIRKRATRKNQHCLCRRGPSAVASRRLPSNTAG